MPPDDSTKDLYFLDPIDLEDFKPEGQGILLYAQEQNQAGYKLALPHLFTQLSQTLPVVRTINGQVGDVVLSPDSINAAYASHVHSISDIIELPETLSGVGSDLSDLGSLVSGLQSQTDSLFGQLSQAGSDIVSVSDSLSSFEQNTEGSITGLQSDIDIHSGILSNYSTRLDTLDASIAPDGSILSQHGDRLDTLGNELTSLENAHDTLNAAFEASAMPQYFVESQLDAIGEMTIPRDVAGRTLLSFLFTVSALGAEETITLLPEGSPDNANWFPLGDPYEMTGDDLVGGKGAMYFAYQQPLFFVRLNWLDGTFAGPVTVDVVTTVN